MPKIKRICEGCGHPFWEYPSNVKAGRKYCSRKCFKKKMQLTCMACGSLFKVQRWRIKRGKVKYCSKKCANDAMALSAVRNDREITCKNCGTSFYLSNAQKKYRGTNNTIYKRGFCSRKCFNEKRGLPVNRICKECGETFKAIPSRIKLGFGMFCSLKCRDNAMSGERASNWQGDIGKFPYHFSFKNALKNGIKKRDRYICQECHKKKQKINLRIHHIDYNKMNSAPNNLISLCKNCHAKTTVGSRKYWKRYYEKKIKAIYKRLARSRR